VTSTNHGSDHCHVARQRDQARDEQGDTVHRAQVGSESAFESEMNGHPVGNFVHDRELDARVRAELGNGDEELTRIKEKQRAGRMRAGAPATGVRRRQRR
jgi:hypothetical protein